MDISNMFGLVRGKYIGEPPTYVDKTKPPGMTDFPKPTLSTWLVNIPSVLVYTPNFVWAVISLLVYNYVPYKLGPDDPASLSPISYDFFIDRFPMWYTLVIGYFSFWHISLYGFNLASRPFISNRSYNLDKVVHNAFWTSCGIVIWTFYENVFCYLWATGRLSYINDVDSFTRPIGLMKFSAALALIPVWRSIHFYFAHRFLHYKPLYQQVHSLHHRNTDTEPFSGLCMHPVEHLYYFSCVLPSLIFYCSPYAFLWNGVHLLLSPAASHSGYEDHFQSDLYHYLHHRYFECNYSGGDAGFMDLAFGTFRSSFEPGEIKPREDAKSSLRLVPSVEFLSYLLLSYSCIAAWIHSLENKNDLTIDQKYVISGLVGFGPVLLACLISKLFHSSSGIKRVNMSIYGNLIHLSLGTLFCSIPVSYACMLTLK